MCCIICQKNGLLRLKNKRNGLVSLALVIVDKWYRNFRAFRSKRQKGNTSKSITFFPKTFHRDEPFHLNSPRNFSKFHWNGKRSYSFEPNSKLAKTRGLELCRPVHPPCYHCGNENVTHSAQGENGFFELVWVGGWHSWLVRGLGARGPEFVPRVSHPCFDFFPFSVA